MPLRCDSPYLQKKNNNNNKNNGNKNSSKYKNSVNTYSVLYNILTVFKIRCYKQKRYTANLTLLLR